MSLDMPKYQEWTYIISLARVRGGDTGAAKATRALGVPLSGCGLSFSVKDPERQSRSKDDLGLESRYQVSLDMPKYKEWTHSR